MTVPAWRDAGSGAEAGQVSRAGTAVALVFAVKGISYAAMVSRIPAIRETLGLSTAQLGLLMLCFSGGAIAGLPVASPVVRRLGPRLAVIVGGITVGAGLSCLGASLLLSSVLPAVAGMMLIGLGNGIWDVAINVQGVMIEHRSGRLLLPRLHGVFGIGAMAGAGAGAGTAAAGVPLAVVLMALAVAVPVSLAVLSQRFLAEGPVRPGTGPPDGGPGLMAAWREIRTLVIGLLVFGFAFTEGSANDWIALAFVDGHRVGQAAGALAYWMFVTAMTAGRLAGGRLVARAGRVAVLRGSAVLAAAGLLLVLLSHSALVALAGSVLWGAGAALGFPLGISSAGDGVPAHAAARVSVVSSIGYTAFLAGPPVLGLIAGQAGILHALLLVLAAPAIAFAAAGAAGRKPPKGQCGERHSPDAHRTSYA